MKIRKNGQGAKINADSKNPTVDQDYYIWDILDGENENDVIVCAIRNSDAFVIISVPNGESFIPSEIPVALYKSSVTEVKMLGGGKATATVRYTIIAAAVAPSKGGKEPKHDPDGSESDDIGPEYSFDTAGGNRHITTSIKTKSSVLVGGGVAPNTQNIIGLSKDKVEGCDVYSSDLKFSVAYKHCKFTFSYLRTVLKLTATTNTVTLLTFQPGEVLYIGGSAHYTNADGWVITHSFIIRENSDPAGFYVTEGREEAGLFLPAKGGHDYVWTTMKDAIVAGNTIQVPSGAWVEQVYREDKTVKHPVTGEPTNLRYLWSAI